MPSSIALPYRRRTRFRRIVNSPLCRPGERSSRRIADLARDGYTFIKTTHFPDHALWISDRVVMFLIEDEA